jgi:hypothetical protein
MRAETQEQILVDPLHGLVPQMNFGQAVSSPQPPTTEVALTTITWMERTMTAENRVLM